MEAAILSCFQKDNLDYEKIFISTIQMKINSNFSYGEIFSQTISKCGINEVDKIICEHAINERLFFKRIFLSVIDNNNLITTDNSNHYTKMLKKYICDELDSRNSNYIDFDILRAYNKYEDGLIVEIMDIAINDYENGLARFSLYRLFEYKGDPNKCLSLFKDRIDILRELYFSTLKVDHHSDHDNTYLKAFFQEGVFSIDDYITFMKSINPMMYLNPLAEKLSCIWKLENYREYIDEALELLFNMVDDPIEKHNNRDIWSSIFLVENDTPNEKQDKWIEEYLIKNIDDGSKLGPVFEVIGGLSQERKLMHITTLVNHEVKINVFKAIQFEPRSQGWSGSELPIIDKKIDFLESIGRILTSATFIEHRAYICEKISDMKRYRKQRHVAEFLRDY